MTETETMPVINTSQETVNQAKSIVDKAIEALQEVRNQILISRKEVLRYTNTLYAGHIRYIKSQLYPLLYSCYKEDKRPKKHLEKLAEYYGHDTWLSMSPNRFLGLRRSWGLSLPTVSSRVEEALDEIVIPIFGRSHKDSNKATNLYSDYMKHQWLIEKMDMMQNPSSLQEGIYAAAYEHALKTVYSTSNYGSK